MTDFLLVVLVVAFVVTFAAAAYVLVRSSGTDL